VKQETQSQHGKKKIIAGGSAILIIIFSKIYANRGRSA
jgi:hypothetical protein